MELQHAPRALLVHVLLAIIKQTVQQHQTECAHLAQQAQVILYQVGLHSVCLAHRLAPQEQLEPKNVLSRLTLCAANVTMCLCALKIIIVRTELLSSQQYIY